MGRTLTPRDCHAIMNLLVKEATGQDSSITVVDSSSFVSAGETVLASGVENTLSALSLIIGRTLVASRAYTGKLNIFNTINSGVYSSRLRKISFYSQGALAAGDWNTQSYTNLAMGFDAGENSSGGTPQSTKSQFEQVPSIPLEMNFGGRSVWQDGYTVYDYQVQQAFRSEADFARFLEGALTEKGNDMASQREAFNRMTLINYMGGLYDMSGVMPGSCINLTYEYNATFGTNYTSEELRTVYLDKFVAFFVAKFKTISDYMTNRSANRHWSPAKQVGGVDYVLMRHTPKDRQRAILFSPFFTQVEARVFPQIFNPQYLSLENYEGVTYWQNENDPAAIYVDPAIPNTASPAEQKKGARVNIPFVLGLLYDVDAIMVDYQLDRSGAAREARKGYTSTWWSYARNAIVDYTEQGVLLYMDDVGGVSYDVTNTLTHVSNSNTAASAYKGGSYAGTLTADDGYNITSVTVTMGGTDITATAYNSDNGKITISNVTGAIVVTATATSG